MWALPQPAFPLLGTDADTYTALAQQGFAAALQQGVALRSEEVARRISRSSVGFGACGNRNPGGSNRGSGGAVAGGGSAGVAGDVGPGSSSGDDAGKRAHTSGFEDLSDEQLAELTQHVPILPHKQQARAPPAFAIFVQDYMVRVLALERGLTHCSMPIVPLTRRCINDTAGRQLAARRTA